MGPSFPDEDPGARRGRRGIDYEAVFRAGVAPTAVITPDLIIADANDAYLAVTGRSREEVVGSELFELFPPDPADERGPERLRASLREVVRASRPDVMDVLRYPLLDKRTGTFQTRYFAPINVPVLDGCGAVAWILHHVEEVTSLVGGGLATLQAEPSPAPGYVRTPDVVRSNRKLAVRASHDRVVSRILQDAMFTALPEPDDLALVARYIANTEADQVGGDWYDAAVLPSGGTMVAMGDVVGHDIIAAASMGQLRGLLRALAWDRDEPPAAILARVERAMPGLEVDTVATAILGRIEPPEVEGVRRLRWSNAGHPPPLVLARDGAVEVLETRNDLPLGAGLGTPRTDHVHHLTPGSTLILYTDGLVERRSRPSEEGIAQLADTLRRHHRLPLGELLDEVIRAVAGDAPEDDIAVLAVSIVPEDRAS